MEELKEGWRRVKLGELINSVSETFKTPNEKVILINTSDVLEGKVLNHELVENKNLKGQFKKKFENGDILYSEIRPQNKRFARIDFDASNYIASTKLMVLRNKNREINSDFLYLILKSNKFIEKLQTIAESRSGTFPQITFNDLANIEIELPLLETQEKIASILSALDDKIEINNEMNKTLEEMAQTLFKRWFIDFDFPNENGEPYRSSGGKMVDSELGEIPEGWEVGNFENIGIIASGGTPSKSNEEYYTKNGIPWITPKDLSLNKNKFITKGSLDITEKGLAKSSTKLLPKGTVLFSSRAPIGYLAIAEVNVTTNQGFKSIIPNNSENTEFIYQLLKEITPHIESIAGGSTFKEISSQGMKSINITIPSDLILKKYFEITESFNKKIQNLEKEIQSLTEIRDTLLPKLMSGEIEV